MSNRIASATLNAYFCSRASAPAPSCFTDGETIYSYATAVATRVPSMEGQTIVNVTQYSRTTSRHVAAILRTLEGHGATIYRVDDLPEGAGKEHLVAACYAQYPATTPGMEDRNNG